MGERVDADDTRWSVRVTAGSRAGWSRAHVRGQSFEAGEPVSFDVEHGATTALEYLLGTVGVELAGVLRVVAKRRRVEIEDVEVLVHGRLADPMVYLRVVGASADPSIGSIEARAFISSLEDEERVAEVWREAVSIAPVINTLMKATRLTLTVQQVL